MTEFNRVGALLAAVTDVVGSGLIGIEGHTTSGKTTLLEDLVKVTSVGAISTDHYVDRTRDSDTYVGLLDADRLKRDLLDASRSFALTFIEGICLRDALSAADVLVPDFIYCKRITSAGLWADDPLNYVEGDEPASFLSWVDAQSVEYHLRMQPLERATWVYSWQGD